jgi:hypothetical protein
MVYRYRAIAAYTTSRHTQVFGTCRPQAWILVITLDITSISGENYKIKKKVKKGSRKADHV